MYNIDLICIGKLKEDYLRGACAEYSKRLSAFCKLKITELTPSRIPDDPSQAYFAAYSPVGACLCYVHRGQAALLRGAQPRH